MVRLRTLDGFGLDIDSAGGAAANVRPRVLALLALLAGHRYGLSRDKILGYLWPDSDADHARNSLKQALFSLRQLAGQSMVISASGVLRLNPAQVEADLWWLEAALERGDEARAAGLCRRPFLDGFYVSGVPDFERWVERERERLRRAHLAALRTLAVRAEQAGDLASSIGWWRQLASLDPLSAETALRLVRTLERAGDPAGALECARTHTAAVWEEFGALVSDEMQRHMGRLLAQVQARLAEVTASALTETPPVTASTPAPFPRLSAGPTRRRRPRTSAAS